MGKINFCGILPPRCEEVLPELGEMLHLEACGSEGTGEIVVEGFHTQGVAVVRRDGKIRLGWEKPIHFYRALSFLKDALSVDEYERHETPCFETGLMLDVSRNAVVRPDVMHGILRVMALAGMDVAMLYTEDTYEVEGEPYIGYMRGRYTQKELKELDDYADMLGIEMIPCIQTLGHLHRVLHWPAMSRYGDNGDVVLADNEETYELLEKMICSASEPFRSKRIHIGMDEAWGLGLGEHLRRFGYESSSAIMKRHLLRVKEITDRYGLEPMMWSDMYFNDSTSGAGYHGGADPTREAIDSVAPGVELVYWDYYHQREEEYAESIRKHRLLSDRVVFAGGTWTWAGVTMDFEKTLQTTIPALNACKKSAIPFALMTAWGDDGAEASLLTALPGICLYAEFAYTGGYDETWLAHRFWTCVGAELTPFVKLAGFNRISGVKSQERIPPLMAKLLLYQDPLVQLFAKDTEGLRMSEHYEGLAEEYEEYAKAPGRYVQLMNFYAILARVLAGKCRWHEGISAAVAAKDHKKASDLADELLRTVNEVEKLRLSWRELWMAVNKPYGFEVIDGRLGWVRARMETAASRVRDWTEDKDDLEELLEEPLPYIKRGDGSCNFAGINSFGKIVSACKI